MTFIRKNRLMSATSIVVTQNSTTPLFFPSNPLEVYKSAKYYCDKCQREVCSTCRTLDHHGEGSHVTKLSTANYSCSCTCISVMSAKLLKQGVSAKMHSCSAATSPLMKVPDNSNISLNKLVHLVASVCRNELPQLCSDDAVMVALKFACDVCASQKVYVIESNSTEHLSISTPLVPRPNRNLSKELKSMLEQFIAVVEKAVQLKQIKEIPDFDFQYISLLLEDERAERDHVLGLRMLFVRNKGEETKWYHMTPEKFREIAKSIDSSVLYLVTSCENVSDDEVDKQHLLNTVISKSKSPLGKFTRHLLENYLLANKDHPTQVIVPPRIFPTQIDEQELALPVADPEIVESCRDFYLAAKQAAHLFAETKQMTLTPLVAAFIKTCIQESSS